MATICFHEQYKNNYVSRSAITCMLCSAVEACINICWINCHFSVCQKGHTRYSALEKSFSSKTDTIQNPSQFYSKFRNTQKSPYNANDIQDLTLISQTTRNTGLQMASNQYYLLSMQTKFCISLNLSSLYKSFFDLQYSFLTTHSLRK